MARDFSQIEKAALYSEKVVAQDNTLSLPPGFIQGLQVRLRQDYTVLVYAGTASIAGRQVRLTEDHQLALADWVAPRFNGTQHYWVYLAKDGTVRVDIVQPVFNSLYGYSEQPDLGWRAIGRMFLVDTNIIFAVTF